jgi:hypothetical protein
VASARFLGKSTGTLRKDLDWKTAEPRDGWGDTTTNGRGDPGPIPSLKVTYQRQAKGRAEEVLSRHTIRAIVAHTSGIADNCPPLLSIFLLVRPL